MTATPFSNSETPKKWVWAIALGVAVLWHFALLMPPWHEIFLTDSLFKTPPPVELNTVSPRQLEAVKRRWKKKQLLLNTDKTPAPDKDKKNPDARYQSDRTRFVEKEQRARQTQVIPTPGGAYDSPAQPLKKKSVAEPSSSKRVTSLKKLGVPFPTVAQNSPQKDYFDRKYTDQENQPFSQPMKRGGDQALADKSLPEGDRNILNTEQSVYYTFYSRLYQAIGPLWQSRIREVPYYRKIPKGEYATRANAIMDSQGRIIQVEITRPSGVPEFDQAVIDSWKKIGRFPNPPTGLRDERGWVVTSWSFLVTVDENFNRYYSPPTRIKR